MAVYLWNIYVADSSMNWWHMWWYMWWFRRSLVTKIPWIFNEEEALIYTFFFRRPLLLLRREAPASIDRSRPPEDSLLPPDVTCDVVTLWLSSTHTRYTYKKRTKSYILIGLYCSGTRVFVNSKPSILTVMEWNVRRNQVYQVVHFKRLPLLRSSTRSCFI